MGKGEIAPFPIVFSTLLENSPPISLNSKLSSENFLSLEESKICRLERVIMPFVVSKCFQLDPVRNFQRLFVNMLKPGYIALYGLITAKTCQKVVSRKADDVLRVDVELKTNHGRFIDMAGRGKKLERRRTRQKFLNSSKF